MLITEDLLYAGKDKDGGWSREQLRLIGADDFEILPDIYWKNRFLLNDIPNEAAERFVALAGAGESALYEAETSDRRYSRCPLLMYQGCFPRSRPDDPASDYVGIPELAANPPFVPLPQEYKGFKYMWKGDLLHNKRGAAVVSADGSWEEYWRDGEPRLIRATRPITRAETEGELLQYREIAPYQACADAAYQSRSERLEWNYRHYRIEDGRGIPIHGTSRHKNTKLVLRFKRGFLDGDTRSGNGKLLVKPAYEREGHIEYWRYGLLHRDNGQPAVIAQNGAVKEWWVNGVFLRMERT
jgi:hypothetical protein